MSVTVSITGLDAIEKALAPEEFDRSVRRALELSAQAWRDDTKKLPPVSAKRDGWAAKGLPVDTGSMAQRIQVETVDDQGASVRAKTNYSKAVHDGSPPHDINSSVFIPGVGWRYIKKHPGNPARPFFDYALESGTLKRIEKIFQEQFESPFLKATRVAK